ncbi:MAG: nucleotidyltransferase domain-containing protein [Candidatus Bathyarchaeia archaeon]
MKADAAAGIVKQAEPQLVQGEYIKTHEGTIFAIIGTSHPPHSVVCYPKYRLQGTRPPERYVKMRTLEDAVKFLRRHHPEYLVFDPMLDAEVCEVARKHIRAVYTPVAKLQMLQNTPHLDAVESDAVDLASEISRVAHAAEGIGVTGSILLGLHNVNSDVDLVIYGSDNGRRVHAALARLRRNPEADVKPCSGEALKALYHARSMEHATRWESFRISEPRKVLQGVFRGRAYYTRLVRLPNESEVSYGDVRFQSAGRATVKAIVENASESVFTPCRYIVKRVEVLNSSSIHASEVREIASFRGRFCEMAVEGETVLARGKLEKVQTPNEAYYRLLLGGNGEDTLITQGARDA